MNTMRFCIVCAVVLLSLAATSTGAQDTPERPPWAGNIPVYATLQPNATAECELCQRPWEKGNLVAQDREDTIFVLDPQTGQCDVYSPEGEELDTFTPSGWQPLKRAPAMTGFATTPTGDLFAAASGNALTIFTRKEVKANTTVPTMISAVTFLGSDVVVGQLPVRIKPREGVFAERWPFLVAWLDKYGAIDAEALEPDPARGPDPFATAMTQDIEIAADPGGVLWALDRHKLYRVRRLSSSGSVNATWISDRTREPASYTGERPEEIAEKKEAAFQPVQAKTVVWDAVARDGFLWVLAKVDGDVTVVDVFDHDCAGPIVRLHAEANWPVGKIAVVDDAVWVFPNDERGTPIRSERDEDWQIRQQAYGQQPGTEEAH